MPTFINLLHNQWEQGRFLCVGLDSEYEKIPSHLKGSSVTETLVRFNRGIIDATAAYAGAFKPNSAFYEGYGVDGLKALEETTRYIRDAYPALPIILDAKRADIGNTNRGYVRAAFEYLGAHAITIHPYLGGEALQPFLSNPDYGVIVLCHTSNPGADELQQLSVAGRPLYQVVAERVSREWNANGNCGLVIGATYPGQLAEVRAIAGDIPFLIPGIGAQGGDLEKTVRNGLNAAGTGIIINASRSIIFASAREDFAAAAGREAELLDRSIRELAGK